eukprot:Skav205514  [mRNA]  locus=scaffold231:258543:262178:- [translate_table: standard]
MLQARSMTLEDDDILKQQQWPQLQTTLDLVDALTGVTSECDPVALPEAPPDTSMVCSYCGFVADSSVALRQHLTTHHAHPVRRSNPGLTFRRAQAGLPECSKCGAVFTSWRSFHVHVERNSCPAAAGIHCWSAGGLRLHQTMEAQTQTMLGLQPADRRHLESLPFGPALIDSILRDDWPRVITLEHALEYLRNRCVMCGFSSHSTLGMHRHYKTHHPRYLENVFVKGSQLQALYGGEGRCDLCQQVPKTRHMCLVSTQLAALMLHGNPDDPGSTIALRCELCMTHHDSQRDLVLHLQSVHRLALNDWVQSRDALDFNQPVCTHCAEQFTSTAALRAHILQGNCPLFDPTLPRQLRDVPAELAEALFQGTLTQFLDDQTLQSMTTDCMFCTAHYSRGANLLQHLLQEHGDLWQAGVPYGSQLVDDFLQPGACLCKPAVRHPNSQHVCVPIRQLAMQVGRLPLQLFVPYTFTDAMMIGAYRYHSTEVADPTFASMLTCIIERDFQKLWTDESFLALLQNHCVFCDQVDTPAALHWHLAEAHGIVLETVVHLMPQLVHGMMLLHDDSQSCMFCGLAFHDPASLMTHESALRDHLSYQCPVSLQICLLLTTPHHDRWRIRVRADSRCRDAGVGTELQGLAGPLPKNQGHRARKAAEETEAGGDRATQRTKRSRRLAADPAPIGGADVAARQAAPDNPGSGFISDFFGKGQPKCIASTDGARPTLAQTPGARHGVIDLEDAPGEAPHSRPDAEGCDGEQGQEGGPALENLPRTQDHRRAGELAFPSMELTGAEAGDHRSTTPADDTALAILRRAGGSCDLGLLGPEVPRPPGGPEIKADTMEAPTEPSHGHGVQPTPSNLWMSGMVPTGRILEGSPADPVTPGDQTSSHVGLEGERQGQRQGQGNHTILSIEDAMTRMNHIASEHGSGIHLCLCTHRWRNDDSDCFVNAAVSAWLWALLQSDLLGNVTDDRLTSICNFLAHPQDDGVFLREVHWLKPTMIAWDTKGQCDAAEFSVLLLRILADLPFVNLQWGKRVLRTDGDVNFEKSAEGCALLVFKPGLRVHAQLLDSITLQQLCDDWHQVDGMYSALMARSPMLCIHVDRTIQLQDGGIVHKHDFSILHSGSVDIPCFSGPGVEVTPVRYNTVAMVAHFGHPSAGHYRAALRHGKVWWITEDNSTPQLMFRLPLDFTQNVTLIYVKEETMTMADVMAAQLAQLP